MARNSSNKRARKTVEENLKYMKKPKLCDIVEMIRPYYTFSQHELLERELKNKARYIMSTFRDKEKLRTYYLDNKGVYVNIENTTDLEELYNVDMHLLRKHTGLKAALGKVRGRMDGIVSKFTKRTSV